MLAFRRPERLLEARKHLFDLRSQSVDQRDVERQSRFPECLSDLVIDVLAVVERLEETREPKQLLMVFGCHTHDLWRPDSVETLPGPDSVRAR